MSLDCTGRRRTSTDARHDLPANAACYDANFVPRLSPHRIATKHPDRLGSASRLAPQLLQMILVASAATEQQKPHARHCLRLGEPHRITDDYLRAWLQIYGYLSGFTCCSRTPT
jgi:hypothetical protein